ncbi:hypothetical protein IW261DRAFT_640417 [Armillaria novae-zelandiae]|uniref:Uncharacterized protein n=1 Tax=Armillaria novae-zelandiae TaxID=153914 RepID=A0AA39TGM4_9AGAR|nr:hypothetical protein IW261DRAFT_640417 [Armillaria novae-zelandiae]
MALERSIWTPVLAVPVRITTYHLHSTSSHNDHIDVAYLATTIDYPAPGGVRALQAIIHDAEEHLAYLYHKISNVTCLRRDLEMQISCLDRRWKDLTQACHYTKHEMKEQRKLLSPIGTRLPAEVFHEIFLATIDFPPEKYWCEEIKTWKLSTSVISSPAVWSIERVSKKWRAAVHGYNNIVRISQHLTRSGQLPPSITIHRPHGSSWNCPPKLLPSLIPFANRIKFLYLFIPTRMLKGFRALEYTCDALQTLVVVANDSVPPPENGSLPDTLPIDIFLKAPHLRKVELRDIFDASYRILLRIKQITEFTNVYRRQCRWSHNHVQPILDFLIRIGLATLYRERDGTETLELRSSIVRCPQLRSLRILFDPDGFPDYFNTSLPQT